MPVINIVNTTHFDFGAIGRLEAALAGLKVERPMLVTDMGLRAAGIADRAIAAAGARTFVEVYDKTPSNPDEHSVLDATAMYKAAGCDGVVGLGGGSSMDLAKGVALLATHPAPLEQYGIAQRGSKRIGPVAPMVAIPTTAGTGSEVSVGAIVILESGRKESFISAHLIPPVAICDPELSLGLPPLLTAATGMDAVTHCFEAILAPTVNPPLEAIGYDGIERAVRLGHLERAVADGSDRDARWQMMMASLEGALAFARGLGAVHALSHASGRLPTLRLHHGTLNAIYLPPVLRFSEGAAPEKYARLRRSMGLAENADLAEAIEALNARIGIPARLSDVGVQRGQVEEIVDYAVTDLAHNTAPRKPTRDEYAGMIEAVL